MYTLIDQAEPGNMMNVGGKADHLFRLKELNNLVPKFVVIPHMVLSNLLPKEVLLKNGETIIKFIEQIDISADFIEQIATKFPENNYWAVRSSAVDEDGLEHSFAGQFESYLYVSKDKLATSIKKVWASLFSIRVDQYIKINNLHHQPGIAVIIQEMVDAEASGVAFGINPVSGNQEEKYINAVYGCGEGLVSGNLNADVYTISNRKIHSSIVAKTHKMILDPVNGGLTETKVPLVQQTMPVLSEDNIFKIEKILDELAKVLGTYQDIEFAIKDGQIYLLQTRPVTSFYENREKTGEYIVWDNSNIIESYPGVTTPLTFSFISQSYETAYKLFAGYMGISRSVIKNNERVFANTLGLINGRVYYNLKSWYHMLAMGPGYSINARYMEIMMGVKERFDIPKNYRLSKSKAWFGILKMIVGMFVRYLALPRKRRQFIKLLNVTIEDYKKINFNERSADDLMKLYLHFEKTLLNEWKAPLLNDFFAMIGYGVLQKRCIKYGISFLNPNIHNDLLCGSNDIISTQPIHRTIELATVIGNNTVLQKLFSEENETTIWKMLAESKLIELIELKAKIDEYIYDFGERCIGELKLESISYTQQPSRFIKVLKSYVDAGISVSSTTGNIEETLRRNAEQIVDSSLKNKWIKKRRLKNSISMTRTLVSGRENLRYERTRAFGMVRAMFVAMGNRFIKDQIIEDARDIFYLTKSEIFAFIEGTSITQNLRDLIRIRKNEFDNYHKQKPPSERFATYGTVYHGNDFYNTSKIENNDSILKGIGCCPGIVRGKVQVILDPTQAICLNGDILVTSSTDPGWVILFPGASGIITERGSVLSHSAIVSREMGKPCIVNVPGLIKILKTGDEIQMNGSTGLINILHQ